MRCESDVTRRGFLGATALAVSGSALGGLAQEGAGGVKRVPIKIGQIGTMNQHAYKIGSLRSLPELFEVVGVVAESEAARKRVENSGGYKGLKWMSEEELLAVPGLQAVAVEMEERVPIPVAERCIRAGKHIHLDKPCGESLPAFKKLLDEAKAAKLAVQVGYMYRNNAAIQFCIKAVREGLIGNVFDIATSMGRYDGASYRKLIGEYKGGIHYILACHLIDIIVSLMGEPEKITPYMRVTRGDGVLDNCLSVFEFDRGRVATVRTSITEAQGFVRRHMTVMGDKGTIIIQPLEVQGNMSGGAVRLCLHEERGGHKSGISDVKMPPPKDRYEDQWREFAAVVNGEIENPYTYEHDYIVHKCHLLACGMGIS